MRKYVVFLFGLLSTIAPAQQVTYYRATVSTPTSYMTTFQRGEYRLGYSTSNVNVVIKGTEGAIVLYDSYGTTRTVISATGPSVFSLGISVSTVTTPIVGNAASPLTVEGTSVTIRSGTRFVGINSAGIILSEQADATNEAVRADRTISAGAGLTGGGDLTANRTLSVRQGAGMTVNTGGVHIDVNTPFIGTMTWTQPHQFASSVTVQGTLWANTVVPATAATMVIGRSGANTFVYGDQISLSRQATADLHAVRGDRQIIAGTGLTGGGKLISDVTLHTDIAAIAAAVSTSPALSDKYMHNPSTGHLNMSGYNIVNVKNGVFNDSVTVTGDIYTSSAIIASAGRIYSPTQYQVIIGTHALSTNTLRLYTDANQYGNIRNAQNAGFVVDPYGSYLVDNANRWMNWTGNVLFPSQPSDIGQPANQWRHGYFSGTMSVGSSITWSGGRIWYVPLGASIATAISQASNGDVLELAAGTYTITASVSITKPLTIRGQGMGRTFIYTTTVGQMFIIQSSNVVISDMMLHGVHSGNINTRGITTSGGPWLNVLIERVGIVAYGATGEMYGISTSGNETTIRDCDITIEQGATGTAHVYGIRVGATSARDNTVTIMRSRIRALGNNRRGIGIGTYFTATSTNTINIYDCDIYGGSNGGTAEGRGLDLLEAAGNAPYANVYGCRIYGVTHDIHTNSPSTDPNKVRLYGTICYNQLPFPTHSILPTGTMFSGGHRIYSPMQYQVIVGTHLASTNTLRVYADSVHSAGVVNQLGNGMVVSSTGTMVYGGSSWLSASNSGITLSVPGDAPNEAVRADRTIATGSGLTGGGNLTADRSLAVVQGAGMTVNTGGVHLNVNTPFIGTMTWTSNHTFASSVSVQSTVESRNLLVNPQLLEFLGYGTTHAALLVASSHTPYAMSVISWYGPNNGIYVEADVTAARLKSKYAYGLIVDAAQVGIIVTPGSWGDAIRIPSGRTGVNIQGSVDRGIYSDASDNWCRKQLAVGPGYIGFPTYVFEASSHTGGTVASVYNSNTLGGVGLNVTGGTAISAQQQAPDGDVLLGTIGGARGYGIHIQDLNTATGTIVAYRAHLDSTGASERYGLYLTGTDLKHYLEGNMTLTGEANPATIKVGGSGGSIHPYLVRDTTDGGLLVRSNADTRAKLSHGGNMHLTRPNASIGYWVDASTSFRWGMTRDESHNLSFRGNDAVTYGLSVCPSSVVTNVQFAALQNSKVIVQISSAQTFPNFELRKVWFSSVVYDQRGDYNSSLSKFTAPHTGIYQVTAQMMVLSTHVPTTFGLAYIYVGGVRAWTTPFNIWAAARFHPINISATVYAVAGQEIDVRIWPPGYTDLTLVSYDSESNRMSIFRVP